MRVGAGETAEVGAVSGALARNEETHRTLRRLLLLRGCGARERGERACNNEAFCCGGVHVQRLSFFDLRWVPRCGIWF
jgi:hypothetical protein